MKRDATILFLLTAVVAVAGLVCSAAVAGDAWTDYQAAKHKALAPFQADYDRIVAAHRDDPAIAKYRERLELVDEVAARVLRGLDAISAASAAGIVGCALGDFDGTEPSSADVGGFPVPGALRLLAEYGGVFEADPPVPDVRQEEQAVLWTYARVEMSEAVAQVAEHARVVHTGAPAEELAHQALCLGVCLSLLGTRDGKWAGAETEALPQWMLTPGNCHALEAFCLGACRPLTAYALALAATDSTHKRQTKPEYLKQAVETLARSRDYHAAVTCLRTAISVSSPIGPMAAGAYPGLYLMLAEEYDATGHPEEAAEAAMREMSGRPDDHQFGRALVLRLIYLYRTGRFSELLDEATKYRNDERCRDYEPQVLYLAWAAHTRNSERKEADEVRGTFLKRFGEHPLAADMYFASALDAMALAEHTEALRLLDIIDHRFPNSRNIGRVRQIQGRLREPAER